MEVKRMKANDIENRINKLPEDLKKEVIDFIDFLIMKKNQDKTTEGFNFNWEGGLAEIKDKYSSVDLQHQANDWR